MINTDIAGRPYQIQAIRSVLEQVEKKHRKFLLVMATGTGKTRTCMGLLDILMRSKKNQKAPGPFLSGFLRHGLIKLYASQQKKDEAVQTKTINKIRGNITALPQKSVVILDNQESIKKVSDDNFWIHITDEKFDYLRMYISPLMRVLSDADFKAMRFELDGIEAQTARLAGDDERYEALKEIIIEKVSELPMTVNIVQREREWIEKVQSNHFWITASDDGLDEMIERLSPLMKFRQAQKTPEKKLNIQNLLTP